MRRTAVKRVALLPAGIALAVALAGVAAAGAQAAPVVQLSDERTRTLAAIVERPVWVRRAPDRRSTRVARLRTETFLGSAEVVLVLARTIDADGRDWYQVRFPGLGASTGWVPAMALPHTTLVRTRLVIDRKRLRARLYRSGRLVLSVPVGVGASASPTPAGRYYVRERLVPHSSGGVYGVLAFGTSAFSPFRTDWPGGGQVGVHGTNQPGLIPGRISNGCVRIANRDVARLDRRMLVGTPLVVR